MGKIGFLRFPLQHLRQLLKATDNVFEGRLRSHGVGMRKIFIFIFMLHLTVASTDLGLRIR